MKNPKVVNLSPNKSNIKLCVSKLDGNEELDKIFTSLIEDLKSKGLEMKKTIIYCRSITACGANFEVLLENLPAIELYGMFHSKTPESILKNVLCEFVKRDSKMRLVVATCALGMGVDIPDVVVVLQALPQKQQSFIKDTTDVINYIEKAKIGQDTILVSMDVSMQAYKRFHNQNPPIPTRYLMECKA